MVLSEYEIKKVTTERSTIRHLTQIPLEEFVVSTTKSIGIFRSLLYENGLNACSPSLVKSNVNIANIRFQSCLQEASVNLLTFKGLLEDIAHVKDELSEESLDKQLQSQTALVEELERRIDALNTKRQDILVINDVISSLEKTNESFSYTEEELIEVFGEATAKEIMNHGNTRVQMKSVAAPAASTTEQDLMKEEDTPSKSILVKYYSFTAKISTDEETLTDERAKLLSSIKSYEDDLTQLKEDFKTKYAMLHSVKTILGLTSEDQDQDQEEQEQEQEEDIDMVDADRDRSEEEEEEEEERDDKKAAPKSAEGDAKVEEIEVEGETEVKEEKDVDMDQGSGQDHNEVKEDIESQIQTDKNVKSEGDEEDDEDDVNLI
ncbi:hypothetical protein WICPIJ_001248 [Wickerhamomyces pijperi]|uniref:Uncharacterized protein n=1 Tax=Wickerhamomyces pijperi TaxID=599730 RepID=A0A9P8QE58_WICPI|nr:hypothetical protein WICPIJ_001248 [Wickerhamomyces pijperi]